jgi:hypothetical protein
MQQGVEIERPCRRMPLRQAFRALPPIKALM